MCPEILQGINDARSASTVDATEGSVSAAAAYEAGRKKGMYLCATASNAGHLLTGERSSQFFQFVHGSKF